MRARLIQKNYVVKVATSNEFFATDEINMATISDCHSRHGSDSRSYVYILMKILSLLAVIFTLILGLHPEDSYAQNYPKARGGLLPVEQNEKWGYIDLTGKLVIPYKFDSARSFAEGLAPVMVDRKVFRLADSRFDIEIGKWGYIDQKGDFVIQPKFENCDLFSEGLAKVWLNGKNGYIDRTGKLIIETQFFHTEPFQGGLALGVREKDRQKEFIDKAGKTVFEIDEIEGMGVSVGNFYDGLATVRYWDPKDRQQDKYGYISKTGVVTFLPYQTTNDFSEGLASVFKDGKNGFINANYDLVIPVKYDEASVFSNGLASVLVEDKYGYIDRQGRLVIPPTFEDAQPFSEGLAAVANEDGKWGFIDTKGKLAIGFKFEDEVGPFIEGIAEVRAGAEVSYLLGYINTKGRFIWKNKK